MKRLKPPGIRPLRSSLRGNRRTLRDFGRLTPAESLLCAAVRRGDVAHASVGLPSENPPEEVRIRANLIRYLALGGCPDCRPHERGIRIYGAYIVGEEDEFAEAKGLDLVDCQVSYDLGFGFCRFPDMPRLSSARLQALYCGFSHFHDGIGAIACQARGFVALHGATVHGDIGLSLAQIGRFLYLDAATIFGEVRLIDAISHGVSCSNAKLMAPEGKAALSGDRMVVQGDVFLNVTEATGEVRLTGAKISGEIVCSKISIAPAAGTCALNADRLNVGGSVVLQDADIDGEVRFVDATTNVFSCVDAKLKGRDEGPAFNADRAMVQGDLFLTGSEVSGEVRLMGATISGDLVCERTKVSAGKSGFALNADRIKVGGGVVLKEAEFTGEARLIAGSVGAEFNCHGAKLKEAGSGWALQLYNADVKGAMFWRNGASADGIIDLSGTALGSLIDDPACWPAEGNLILDQCRYGAFEGRGVSGKQRVNWLNRQIPRMLKDDFRPQPWEYCARVLREMGHGDDARTVLIRKERLQRRALRSRRNPLLRWWHWLWDGLLGITVRYGRRPLFAIWWLLFLWGVGAVVFLQMQRDGVIKPNNAGILRSDEWVDCAGPPEGEYDTQLECWLDQPQAQSYSAFNPYIYSADALLPIISLGMVSTWTPDEDRRPRARWYLWFHTIAGWALSLLAVAGFTGLVKSD